jgi:vacuolar-type H+-ATPase subunit E/Vma4
MYGVGHSLEAFVQKLHTEGVEAGRAAAERILAEAEHAAKTRIADANEQAREIVERARAESETIRARAESELRLAVRDAVLRLQEALSRALRATIWDGVRKRLDDREFLAPLIRDVVMRYVEADAAGNAPIAIMVSEDVRRQLATWALEAFAESAQGQKLAELRGTLADSGFACRVSDGTVEVTADSVVEVLWEMVGPELRNRIAAAVEQEVLPERP